MLTKSAYLSNLYGIVATSHELWNNSQDHTYIKTKQEFFFHNINQNKSCIYGTTLYLLQSNWDEVVDNFDDMNLCEELLRGIYAYGFEKPSAIQQRAILPCIKGKWKSILDFLEKKSFGRHQLIISSMHRWRMVVCYLIMPVRVA